MTQEAAELVRLAFAGVALVIAGLFVAVLYLWSSVDRLRERVARLEGAAGHSPESSPPRPR